MDIWSKYRQLGLWGIWLDFFGPKSLWYLKVGFAEHSFVLDGNASRVLKDGSPLRGEVFSWCSPAGFSLALFADPAPSSAVVELWRLLLYYESATWDLRPTFLPFYPPGSEFADGLNELLASPGQIVLLSGQPGVGKRTLLQSLSLLHAGRLSDLEPQSVSHWVTGSGDVWVVPEVAMLETDVQQKILKSVGKGARLWAATAYDLGVLQNRKIVVAALAELLGRFRRHLPPVSGRSESDMAALVDFWTSFYGIPHPKPQANLEFVKQRTLFGSHLSVGSILEEGSGLRGVIAEFEKEAIRQAHARVGRSQHKIARLLKVSRGSLQHKLRKYQLESYASADADTEEEG